MQTFNELERAAYLAGNTALADAFFERENLERLEAELCAFELYAPMDVQIERHVTEETEKKCPDYEAYRQFFYGCFARLNGHYPCPSVTSDYDQSVIFDAIAKGDAK